MEVTKRGEITCPGCLNMLNLDREEFIIAVGQEWHADCFRCSVCDAYLHNWYFEKEGMLFCRDDYCQRFEEACQQCTAVITGPVMVAGDHKFHPECFSCSACGGFIGDGESYALVERSKLYCGQCYKHQVPSSKTTSSASDVPLHSIRLVEISKDLAPGLRLSVDNVSMQQRHLYHSGSCEGANALQTFPSSGHIPSIATVHLDSGSSIGIADGCPAIRISEIDVNLANLHIGDRILEVNGTPVSDSSIEQIDKLIRSTEKILQLTVEHDPVQVCRSCSQVNVKKIAGPPPPLTTSASSVEMFAASNSPPCSTGIRNNKPRLYKRKEDTMTIPAVAAPTYVSGTKTRQLRKCKLNQNLGSKVVGDKVTIPSHPVACGTHTGTQVQNTDVKATITNEPITTISFRNKERCSSMSKLLDDQHQPAGNQMYDLSRTQSFRIEAKTSQRIFRASDLVLGELLGKGFFGQVFKVTHRLTKEVMVLKELYRVDEEAQRNFLKEVAVLRSLHHTNVLRFIGVLYKDKKLHLVTEFVAGGSLKELIHDSGLPLSWSQRVSVARDIACGMAYLHSRNIIHRDLNSLNCLVREDHSVLVADFGLARIITSPLYSSYGGASTNSVSNFSSHGSASISISGSSNCGTFGRSKSRQRRQRYTVVGNPYWMAPEMMKGFKYDEKVDVFSFGIVLCEIIGRVQADPDFLPRTSDFGLNEKVFREKFCHQCPDSFSKVAFLCCDLNPDKRPSFEILEVWLDSLFNCVTSQQKLPPELVYDIEHYTGQSISSTPDDVRTPRSNLSRDDLDEFGRSTQTGAVQTVNEPCLKTETINGNDDSVALSKMSHPFPVTVCSEERSEQENVQSILPSDIPKSPHLGKDFSPTGERIRDSLRARRRQRMIHVQQNTLTPELGGVQCTDRVLEAVKQTLQNGKTSEVPKRSRPYGDKGFLLDPNRDGDLRLNNVRDLNNYSDFDSSCDTSLNYHEVNTLDDQMNTVSLNNETSTILPISEVSTRPTTITSNPAFSLELPVADNKQPTNQSTNTNISDSKPQSEDIVRDINTCTVTETTLAPQKPPERRSYRSALDDIRMKLNLCRHKFDSVDSANRKNVDSGENSIRTILKLGNTNGKIAGTINKSPPQALRMFQHLEAQNNANSQRLPERTTGSKIYRLNQTPIFGRSVVTNPIDLYIPHSESLEDLHCPVQPAKDTIAVETVNKPAILSPTTNSSRQTTSTAVMLADSLRSFNKSTTKRTAKWTQDKSTFRSYVNDLEQPPAPKRSETDTSNKINKSHSHSPREANTPNSRLKEHDSDCLDLNDCTTVHNICKPCDQPPTPETHYTMSSSHRTPRLLSPVSTSRKPISSTPERQTPVMNSPPRRYVSVTKAANTSVESRRSRSRQEPNAAVPTVSSTINSTVCRTSLPGHRHISQRPPLPVIPANSQTKQTRVNILSPEKVHRLNAKMADQRKKLNASGRSVAAPVPMHSSSISGDDVIQNERRKRFNNRVQLATRY